MAIVSPISAESAAGAASVRGGVPRLSPARPSSTSAMAPISAIHQNVWAANA